MEAGFCEAGLEFLNAGKTKLMLQRLQNVSQTGNTFFSEYSGEP